MLKIGFGARDITPPPGTAFGGFALERTEPAEGAHDRLMALAAALGGDDGVGLVIACDLQLVTPDLVAAAREEIEDALNVPAEAVLVHATHDHAAPGGDASETAIPGVDPEFGPHEVLALTLDGIVGAAMEAVERLTPARLRQHSGVIPGIGRRRHDPSEPRLAPARLIVAEDADGTPLGALAHYACHPSVLGPENRLFSADFPGVVRRELALNLGGAPVIYLNGPAGDLSTRHTRRESTYAEMLRLGAELAEQLRGLLRQAGRDIIGEQFAAALGTADLPLALPPEPELRRRLALAESAVRQAGEDPDRSLAVRRARFALERARRLRRLGPTVPAELQALRLGELRLLGVGAEVFSELGYALAAMPQTPLVIAPANGTVGVVVPDHLRDRQPTIFGPGAGDSLLRSAMELVRRLDDLESPPPHRPLPTQPETT